jgi:hypothetical protein
MTMKNRIAHLVIGRTILDRHRPAKTTLIDGGA